LALERQQGKARTGRVGREGGGKMGGRGIR
jgi:hypothetical protein